MTITRWTTQALEALPDEEGTRYEVIDGELYMSKAPHWNHQAVCFQIGFLLATWNSQSGSGKVSIAPGIIFSNDNNVIPDVVWISKARLIAALGLDGKLHSAPELVIEVLSPEVVNAERDYIVKRGLYSRLGVNEYWIISWPERRVEVYRRNANTGMLELAQSLYAGDTLTSPELPGFACVVSEIFSDIVG